MHLGVIAVCLRKAANAKFLLVLSCEHVGAHHLLEELIDLRMHSFTHVRVHHVGRMHCPCALDMASSVNRKLLELKRVPSVNRKLHRPLLASSAPRSGHSMHQKLMPLKSECIHAVLRAAYFSKSFLQDALQRRDDRGIQTEKQQDGHKHHDDIKQLTLKWES